MTAKILHLRTACRRVVPFIPRHPDVREAAAAFESALHDFDRHLEEADRLLKKAEYEAREARRAPASWGWPFGKNAS